MEVNDETKQTIERNIKAGISRLSTFITSDGGFSYWPGNSESNDWGTSYAGHFLLEAEKKGYSLPLTLKQNGFSIKSGYQVPGLLITLDITKI